MAFIPPAAEAIVAIAHATLAILEGIQSLDDKRSRSPSSTLLEPVTMATI